MLLFRYTIHKTSANEQNKCTACCIKPLLFAYCKIDILCSDNKCMRQRTVIILSLSESLLTYPDSKVPGSTWGHLGPVGPRWALCWPQEPCSQGIVSNCTRKKNLQCNVHAKKTILFQNNVFEMSSKIRNILLLMTTQAGIVFELKDKCKAV